GDMPPEPRGGAESLPEPTRSRYRAARFIFEYELARRESNFPHHYLRARIERTDEASTARRLFFEADGLRLQNNNQRALKVYESPKALPAWLNQVLLANPEFRKDTFVQEQSFEIEQSYLRTVDHMHGPKARRIVVTQASLLMGGSPVPAACLQPLV